MSFEHHLLILWATQKDSNGLTKPNFYVSRGKLWVKKLCLREISFFWTLTKKFQTCCLKIDSYVSRNGIVKGRITFKFFSGLEQKFLDGIFQESFLRLLPKNLFEVPVWTLTKMFLVDVLNTDSYVSRRTFWGRNSDSFGLSEIFSKLFLCVQNNSRRPNEKFSGPFSNYSF